jgi:four helix bundle protein
MAEFDFEKLQVYQKAISFADEIYRISKGFPKQEQFGITAQLRRAALSISLNLAEGVGRDSHADRKRFYYFSRGSVYECVPILVLAAKQSFLPPETQKRLLTLCHELARMLNGLIASLR